MDEGGEHIGSAPGDEYARRVEIDEPHSVAENIGPHAGTRA